LFQLKRVPAAECSGLGETGTPSCYWIFKLLHECAALEHPASQTMRPQQGCPWMYGTTIHPTRTNPIIL